MTSPARRALHHPRVEPYVSAGLRSRLVRPSLRFFANEAREREVTAVYQIRESALRAQLTHGTPDILTLDQAYYQHAYEPPARIATELARQPGGVRALDLGANIGMWGLWLHGRFAVARVTALEPDPANAAKHRRQIELNSLAGSWELIEAAATRADGPVRFATGQATTGRIGEEGESDLAEVAGRDAFALLDDVNLLKIDIEGAEWRLTEDERWAQLKVAVVMLEHHPHGAPSADPGADAASALERAGYTTFALHGAPDGTGVVWGLRG